MEPPLPTQRTSHHGLHAVISRLQDVKWIWVVQLGLLSEDGKYSTFKLIWQGSRDFTTAFKRIAYKFNSLHDHEKGPQFKLRAFFI